MEGRAGFATGIAQLVQVLDPNFETCDKNAVENYLFTDVMKVPEEKFAIMFPKKKAVEAEASFKAAQSAQLGIDQPTPDTGSGDGGDGTDDTSGDAVTESAVSRYVKSLQ